MTIDGKIRDEKLQQVLTEKQPKYQLYRPEKSINMNMLHEPSYQRRVIEQAKFRYSPLEKALKKQITAIEDQGKKKIKAIMETTG